MRAALACMLAAGCVSRVNADYCTKHGTDHQYCPWLDGGAGDAAQLCVGPGPFAVCVDAPAQPVTVPMDLDTDLSTLCLPAPQPAMWKAAGQPDACFVVGTTVDISGVRAHGGRPLVVIASDAITVTALDVSNTQVGTDIGAGYDASVCGTFGQGAGASANGGGGGAGGTYYMNFGGNGGNAAGGGIAGGTPTPAVTMPVVLRGGCPGQIGGNGNGANGGAPGIGGGAVYLVAGNQLDLTNATINASGAGGSGGGSPNAGGGGGGSGGMIVLHATTIGASGAKLLANGGGGGGFGGAAQPGMDPPPAMPNTPALGGATGGGAGFGGPTNAQAGATGTGGNGGGGGGGGGGYIQANHVLGTTLVSPSATTI
jgi:hypothetical protein